MLRAQLPCWLLLRRPSLTLLLHLLSLPLHLLLLLHLYMLLMRHLLLVMALRPGTYRRVVRTTGRRALRPTDADSVRRSTIAACRVRSR